MLVNDLAAVPTLKITKHELNGVTSTDGSAVDDMVSCFMLDNFAKSV